MAVGATLGYTYSELRKRPSLSSSSNISHYTNTILQDTSKNTSIIAPLDTTKYIPSDSTNITNPIISFSSDIVIYNSHPDEIYPSGTKVTDVGALISDKLVKEGLKSSFIKCNNSPTEYLKAYQTTRNLITENVKEYSNTINERN